MVAPLVYIAFIESRRARRKIGKHKHTTEFLHVLAQVHDTELSNSKSMGVQKWPNFSLTYHDYPFVSRQFWS